MVTTETYGNVKNILIGQASYYIALPVVLSGTKNTTIEAGSPLTGDITTRGTTDAVGILLHDVVLDDNGKGNGTVVLAGCVDLLKLSSTVQGNITTALADDGQKLDRIIFVKGSAI